MTPTKKSLKVEWINHAEALTKRIEDMENQTTEVTWVELFNLFKGKTMTGWEIHLKEFGAARHAVFSAGVQTRLLVEQAKSELSQPIWKG